MSDRTVIVARIVRLARALSSADTRNDDAAALKWSIRLADAATSVAVLIDPTTAEEEVVIGAASSDLTGLFAEGSGDTLIIVGGSPDNPNGVSFTFDQAKAWWALAFADGLNIGRVRSSLTPGSKALSPEGVKAAKALGVTSTNYAPEDYNPLGLEVIA